jgi:hypothetical protein
VSLSSYSQTDTTINRDTTKVILSTRVARLAYQDLIRYDGAKLEIVELNKIIGFKDQQILSYKEKDEFKNQKIGNLELIITKKDEQFSLERQKSDGLLKELKAQRTKTFFYKVGTFVGVIATSILLLK